MRITVRTLHILTLGLAISLVSSYTLLAQDVGPTIYVWEFANRDGTVDETTKSLTEEFEEALIQSGCCTILQRRNYAALFEQRQNERAIMKRENLPEAAVNSLKTLEANAVAFGEVYKDLQGGVVRISVNFETFESTIYAKTSALLPPYDYVNPFKRKEIMAELLGSLPFVDGPAKRLREEDSSDLDALENLPVSNIQPQRDATQVQRNAAFFENSDARFEVISANNPSPGKYSLSIRITNKTQEQFELFPISEGGWNSPCEIFLFDELGNVSDTRHGLGCNPLGRTGPPREYISLEPGGEMLWRITNAKFYHQLGKDDLKGKVLSLHARFYSERDTGGQRDVLAVRIDGIKVGD